MSRVVNTVDSNNVYACFTLSFQLQVEVVQNTEPVLTKSSAGIAEIVGGYLTGIKAWANQFAIGRRGGIYVFKGKICKDSLIVFCGVGAREKGSKSCKDEEGVRIFPTNFNDPAGLHSTLIYDRSGRRAIFSPREPPPDEIRSSSATKRNSVQRSNLYI